MTLRSTAIIGFGHKARQGKDEAVRALEAIGGGRVRRFAFSDALYALCRVHYGMVGKDPVLLQDVGLNYRKRDPNVWIDACLASIEAWDAEAAGRQQVALIPDVRFPNEAEMIAASNGHLVRVRRWIGGHQFIASDRPADHPSEIALNDYPWQHTIDAESGDHAHLIRSVEALGEDLAPWVFQRRVAA